MVSSKCVIVWYSKHQFLLKCFFGKYIFNFLSKSQVDKDNLRGYNRNRLYSSFCHLVTKFFIIIWPFIISCSDRVYDCVSPSCSIRCPLRIVTRDTACIHSALLLSWLHWAIVEMCHNFHHLSAARLGESSWDLWMALSTNQCTMKMFPLKEGNRIL